MESVIVATQSLSVSADSMTPSVLDSVICLLVTDDSPAASSSSTNFRKTMRWNQDPQMRCEQSVVIQPRIDPRLIDRIVTCLSKITILNYRGPGAGVCS